MANKEKVNNGVTNEELYETISFPMMKGSKEIIKNHCDSTNETYHSFLRRAVINQIARDRQAMADPSVEANTKYEGWIHEEDNVKRQIVDSLQDWIKNGKKGSFDFVPEK